MQGNANSGHDYNTEAAPLMGGIFRAGSRVFLIFTVPKNVTDSLIGWRTLREFLNQWETKGKTKVNNTHAFSRGSRRLHVVASSLIGSLSGLWLARVIALLFISRHHVDIRSTVGYTTP